MGEKAVFLCHPPQGANAPQEPGPRNLKHSSVRLNNNSIVELCGEGANVIDKEGVDLGPPPSLETALSHVAPSAESTSESNRRPQTGEKTRRTAQIKKAVIIWQSDRREEALPELRHHGLSLG